MVSKEEILQFIKTVAENNVVTKVELIAAYEEGSKHKASQELAKRLSIAEILYYIGGGIVFLGISIMVLQNWSTLNAITKILATLGSGIAAYISGLLFSTEEKTEKVGSGFYLISALIMPLGLFVVFDNAGLDATSHSSQSLISAILLVTYLLTYIFSRKTLPLLFSIIFGTWLFFSFTSFLVNGNPSFSDWKYYEYRTLVAGLAYLYLGYSFSQNERVRVTGFLYSFGIVGFLGAALSLGGWEPSQNLFWELVFPLLVLATLLLSVYIKSNAFLTFGTLFLMAYILKITSEYFSSGLGWPLALVLAGLTMIAVGYMSLYLKREYISA